MDIRVRRVCDVMPPFLLGIDQFLEYVSTGPTFCEQARRNERRAENSDKHDQFHDDLVGWGRQGARSKTVKSELTNPLSALDASQVLSFRTAAIAMARGQTPIDGGYRACI